VTENYFKFEVRAVVIFFNAEGVSQSEIRLRLVSVYCQNVLRRKEVSVWCNIFKDGRMALNYDPEKRRSRLLEGSKFVKRIAKTVVQYFTSLGKEHCREGMLNL
jgi:hypothetical protein